MTSTYSSFVYYGNLSEMDKFTTNTSNVTNLTMANGGQY